MKAERSENITDSNLEFQVDELVFQRNIIGLGLSKAIAGVQSERSDERRFADAGQNAAEDDYRGSYTVVRMRPAPLPAIPEHLKPKEIIQ